MFFGCDRGTAVNGIQVPIGEITDFYFEEAFELRDYELFRKIDGSLRGNYTTYIKRNHLLIPKQVTFLLNPRQKEGCWLYDVFVKPYLPDRDNTLGLLEKVGYRIYKNVDKPIGWGIGLCLHQSSYKVNHWRDKETIDKTAQEEKKRAPLIYKTEFLGMWGVTGEVVYAEFKDSLILPPQVVQELNYQCFYVGVDTAYSNGEGQLLTGSKLELARIHHAYAIVLCGMTRNDYKGVEKGTIVALDEFYHTQEITNQKLSQTELIEKTIDVILNRFSKYQNNLTLFRAPTYIFVDSGDAGSLSALQTSARNRRLPNLIFKSSTKLKINTRIRFERQLMAYEKMRFSSDCPNLIRELRHCHEGKGKPREDVNDHAINAWEYGTAPMYTRAKEWSNFKEY